MRHPGYKHTEITKKKLSEKAKLRGNSWWKGRKHRPEVIEKMRKPKSLAHKLSMSEAAKRRWRKNKPGWVTKRKIKIIDPVPPVVYHDIFMPTSEEWDGIKDII